MFSFKWIYFVIFTLILCESQALISDKRLCIDKNCSEIISVGKTLLRYASPEEHVLSFGINEDVTVYSYGAGTRPDLIGVDIKGKRGYINKNHFKELNLVKRPKLIVNTEIVTNKSEVLLEGAADINADPTQQPFETVDGTRIPLDLDNFSTEPPIVNVVSDQSNGGITEPLNSVPDNQNVNIVTPREPDIVTPEHSKNVDKQQRTETNNEEDEDSEDDDDPEDSEVDDDDEESEPENENTEAPNEDRPANVVENVPSETLVNVANDAQDKAGVLNNITDNSDLGNNVGNKIDELTEASNVDNGNMVSNNSLKEVIEENNAQSSYGNEPIDVSVSTSEKMQMASEYVKEITKNIKKELVEASQDKPVLTRSTTEGSAPLLNMLGGIQSPQVEKMKEESSEEPSTEKIKENLEEHAIDNAESNENMVDEAKESKSVEVPPPTLPVSSTEAPINFEIEPPANFDAVTPNPVNIPDINNLEEENSKNDTEDSPSSTYSLPSELMPEFKDPEEGVDIKVEEKSTGGLFDKLSGILPMFNSGDDREVDENSPMPDDKEGDVSVESEHNNDKPVDSESSDDNPGFSDQDDFSFLNKSEVAHENEPENNDVADNLNSESPKQNADRETNSEIIEKIAENQEASSGGFLSSIIAYFHGDHNENNVKKSDNKEVFQEYSASSDVYRPEAQELKDVKHTDTLDDNPWSSKNPSEISNEANNEICDKDSCAKYQGETEYGHKGKISRGNSLSIEDLQILFIDALSSDLFLYLTTTAISVSFLVFGMVILDKCRREGPLIARINKLEQQLLTTVKENEMLLEKNTTFVEEKTQLVIETVPNEVVDELNHKLAEMHQVKLVLEEQIQALEKELDTSTEVGIELNKIITEMLNSSDGSEIIKENIEQMQKKLLEQQDTINTNNNTLSLKETENHELRLEMEISNKKVTDLQSELNRLVEKILKIEEERDQQHSALENEIIVYQTKCKEFISKEQTLNSEIQALKQQLAKFQRLSEVKVREYNSLKENLTELKAVKNNKDVLKSLLEVSEIRAQSEQLRAENLKYTEQLSQEREANAIYGGKIESLRQDVKELREKYERADKEKVEINTKLQVLNNYFKEKEDQMQKEISKYESLWAVKEGEATSTTERIRYMQEELQNYKAQNDSLKQEIVNQEVELKSQISMLEKKAHESWVTNRQTERKFEEARQEAAQLRNRLTLRERAMVEGNNQARIQSPLHHNGELPVSPPPLDPTQSPPPLFNPRDHLAKSPPIPGMPPPPFLPPPLGGAPFIPPPPLEGMMPPPMGDMGGMPPPHFMPPLPPGMYPGDHRPPPLGRMSSPPPVGGRYTPDSTIYSDYDRYRRSPSPPYDSEYGVSPPPIRAYSPYQDRLRDDRRDYRRPQARSNGRNSKGMHSSGSENDSQQTSKKAHRKV